MSVVTNNLDQLKDWDRFCQHLSQALSDFVDSEEVIKSKEQDDDNKDNA